MKVVISSGHGLKVRGAACYLDEVDEARRVVNLVAQFLRILRIECVVFHDDVSTSQQENLERIVDFHNSEVRDLDISVHFNAFESTTAPMGTETWCTTAMARAEAIVNKIAEAGFINRGSKWTDGLYFLNHTAEPAVLIEVCFVDSEADAELYAAKFFEICKLIAEGIISEDGEV